MVRGGREWWQDMKREVSGVRKSQQNQVNLHVHAHIIGGDVNVQDKRFLSEWPPSSVTGLASTKWFWMRPSLGFASVLCLWLLVFHTYLSLWLGVCICQDSPALASRVWETLEGAAVQSRQVSGGRLCPPVVDRRSHWVVVPPVLNTFLRIWWCRCAFNKAALQQLNHQSSWLKNKKITQICWFWHLSNMISMCRGIGKSVTSESAYNFKSSVIDDILAHTV